ncbi:helix-turn-helix transcriptional regulator [Citrobacter farmeri]|uniref:helix-turn-helix transcriptional regulator n=1 Tax=Citrobacter farmeri TaxID=67824 RepID=UPI00339CADC0
MKKEVHQVKQHRCVIPDIEILSLYSERTFPRHSHDQFGIGVFIQGSHRSWSNIGNVNAVTGDIIMVNPGEIHDGIPASGPRGWHMLYINPDAFIKEWNTDLPTDDLTLKPVANDPALGLMIRQLFSQSAAGDPDTMAIEETIMRCLMQAGQNHTLSATPRILHSPTVRLVKEFIDDAPEGNITLTGLATLCDITRFQLIRRFSREVGITPHAYLLQSRVRLAKKLLSQGKRTVDVAMMAGFSDQSHLTRAFQKQTGITPGQYRSAVVD